MLSAAKLCLCKRTITCNVGGGASGRRAASNCARMQSRKSVREGWKQADPDLDRLLPGILANLAQMRIEPVAPFVAQVYRQMDTQFSACSPAPGRSQMSLP